MAARCKLLCIATALVGSTVTGCRNAELQAHSAKSNDARSVNVVEQAVEHPLAVNRDRLFSDLAARKGTNTCDLWSQMIAGERYQFLVQTLVLGTGASYLRPPTQHYRKNRSDSCGGDDNCDSGCIIDRAPPPTCGLDICHFVSGPDCAACGACDIDLIRDNFETLLDHATSLYSINGPRRPDTADGLDYDRTWLGFDAEATYVIRNRLAGGGSWVDSNDPAGPHDPFNRREDIAWGSCFFIYNGPTRHHWGRDSDLRTLCSRLGVGLVTDPSVVEVATSFTCFHDANPALIYGDRFGFQIAADHLGPGQYDWTPAGCTPTLPAPDSSYTHVALGPNGCAGGANSAAFRDQSVPTAMIANRSYGAWVTMRNNGAYTWFSEIGYRLGSQNPQDNYRWGFNRVELPSATSPGHDVTFNSIVTAPSSPGSYPFQWRMLREGVEWFGDFTPIVIVNVDRRDTYTVNIRCSGGKYMTAENGGGGGYGSIKCDRDVIGVWETLQMNDLTSGELSSGHQVTFRTADNVHFLQAVYGGGGWLTADPHWGLDWETFTIEKVGGGPIHNGDSVDFRTWNGTNFWVAEGGGGDVVNANRTSVGPWETFTIIIQ